MAVIVSAKGNLQEAETLLRQVVELDRKVFGSHHPSLAVDLSGLARVLMMQQRFGDAEPFARESLEIRRLRLALDDERVLKTQVILAECLVNQGCDSDAELLLAEALQQGRPFCQPGSEFWLSVVDTLEKIYRRSGMNAKEAEVRALKADLTTPCPAVPANRR